MGRQAEKLRDLMKEVRPLIHKDNVVCNQIVDCTYQQYLLNNKDNVKVIDEALATDGIKVMIAPTGSGKSYSLLSRAKELVKKNKDCRVIIALPSRALTMQVGKQKGVCAIMAGDKINSNAFIICTTYEKMFSIQEFIEKERSQNKKQRIVLLLDEAHLLETQHLFRSDSIKGMIQCIENKLFDNVLLITATPEPLSLFRCDSIIEFMEENKLPSIGKIEILEVDSVSEYIKGLNYDKEFPFVRLNSKKKIEQLVKEISHHNIAKITSSDKNGMVYQDIINHSKIDGSQVHGILATSVIEAGVNITSYDENKVVPMVVFEDSTSISCDDIEQFLNRIRRVGNKYVKVARVVLKKTKDKDVRVSLVSDDGAVLCVFQDVAIKRGDLFVNDVKIMDSVPDGKYKLKIELGAKVCYRNLIISSEGATDITRYSKEDSIPIMFYGIGFKPFTSILKANCISVERIQSQLQALVDAMKVQRERKQSFENLTDDEMELLEIDDEKLIESMTKGAIDTLGSLKDCLSYADGEIQVDKRILHMLSYNQYQSQYYNNREILRDELEQRMGVPVAFVKQDTGKETSTYNVNDIWENLEDLRTSIICTDDYCADILGKGKGLYLKSALTRDTIHRFKCKQLLMELLESLDKAGVHGGMALKILTSSKTKAKVTRYKNLYHIIVYNAILDKFNGDDAGDIVAYTKNEKFQKTIYCYLQQRGQTAYTVNEKLAVEISAYYKEVYPLGVKVPKERAITMKLKQMYKKKDKDTIKNEVRTNVDDIFKIVKSDY